MLSAQGLNVKGVTERWVPNVVLPPYCRSSQSSPLQQMRWSSPRPAAACSTRPTLTTF